MSHEPRYYSQRMLNPYHGMVNVVELLGADAVSRDCVNWALYIQGGIETQEFADGQVHEVPLPDIKFGTWSDQTGLQRAPVRFVTDYDRLDHIGELLLAAVKAGNDRVPFPQRDCYELWLLDRSDQLPLALLESSCDQADTRRIELVNWRSGQAASKSFRSETLPESDNHAELLARKVKDKAGSLACAQWFSRDAEGNGVGMGCSDAAQASAGRRLPNSAFPSLLLREAWDSHQDTRLVRDYLGWQAPWLLALQTLTQYDRKWLETEACKRALLVEQLYRTYPEVVDQTLLKAARVEAVLRKAAGEAGMHDEKATTTFFVTGN